MGRCEPVEFLESEELRSNVDMKRVVSCAMIELIFLRLYAYQTTGLNHASKKAICAMPYLF